MTELSGRVVLWVRTAVTLIAFWLIYRQIDVGDLLPALAAANPAAVLASVVVLVSAFVLSAIRWYLIVVAYGAARRFPECLRLYAVSVFFNQLLPTSIGGDVYRALAANALEISRSEAIESVVVDRMLALVSQIALILLLVPFTSLAATPPQAFILVIVMAALAPIVGVFAVGRVLPYLSRPVAARVLRSAVRLRRLMRSPSRLVLLLALSVGTHVLIGLSLWLAVPPQATNLSFVDVVFLSGCIVLVTALPISIGGWGLREGGVVAGLIALGVNAESAAVTALLWAFSHVCLGLPGLSLWMTTPRD